MKQNKSTIVFVFLCISFVVFSSCKRNGIQEPNPFGPSTFSILLKLAAAPNVIFAGDTRESTTVTATLKRYNGSPIANTVVHFDIRDAAGNKANLGFFEGNESVKTRTTDQNGLTSVSYYGPFSQELTTDRTIYISANVAWEGNEFINEITPIYLIRDAVDLTFTLIADPNILLATENRPQSQLKSYFKTVDGVPLAGRRVYFEILSGPGTFSDDERKTFALTDANGYAVVTYFGPTKSEIDSDQIVTIQGEPETATPFNIQEQVDIRLISEESKFPPELQLAAAPNVLIAGNTRESTTVTATLKQSDGVPIPNTDVHFSIRYADGSTANLGFFEGNTAVKTETTDQNGMLSVTYYGPLSHEVTADTTIYIDARVAWSGSDFISGQTPIYLIRDAVDLTFTLIADPNVLQVTDSRPQSQIRAYFKTVDGVPLAGRKVYFDILTGPGTFEGADARRTFALTDALGYAVVTYFGPLIDEIESDQTATIQAQPETISPYNIKAEVDIRLIREESITTPTLQLTAVPNAVVAGTTRGSSTITATLKQLNEDPVTNTEIHFSIRDASGNQISLGYFAGNEAVTTENTDGSGTASVVYIGPLSGDLTADTTIYIQGRVAWQGDNFITAQTPVYLIRSTETMTISQVTNSHILFLTDNPPYSQRNAFSAAVNGILLFTQEREDNFEKFFSSGVLTRSKN